jgi:hypothetical protein
MIQGEKDERGYSKNSFIKPPREVSLQEAFVFQSYRNIKSKLIL